MDKNKVGKFKFNDETKNIAFTFDENPYGDETNLFRFEGREVRFKPGMNFIIGPNGSGKSTILKMIENIHAKQDSDFELVAIDDRRDGGDKLVSKATLYGDFTTVSTMFSSSEGERILIYLGSCLSTLKEKIQENKKKAFVILLDSLDSGLSVDRIKEINDVFENYVAKEADNVYIIAAVNTYAAIETAFNLVDATTGRALFSFNHYHHFRNFINMRAKQKNTGEFLENEERALGSWYRDYEEYGEYVEYPHDDNKEEDDEN